MMNETEFHRLADRWLTTAADVLEAHEALDVEHGPESLTIETGDGKTLLVSKHAMSRQLWLASPVSGGLHFPYRDGEWRLADGRTLNGVLAEELETLAGLNLSF